MNKQYIKAEIQSEKGGMVAVASTAIEDRHGEIVEVEGWDVGNYQKNPVLLWGHNHDEFAIGIAEKVWTEKTAKGTSALMFKPKFHDITERARAAKRLVEENIIKAFSVGFQSKEMDDNKFTEQELLEISLVNVPANPDAMMLSYKTLKDDGVSDKTIREVVDINYIKMKQEIEMLTGKVDSLVKGAEALNPKQGRVQDVIESRIAFTKVVARASDNILRKKERADKDTINLAKIIKKANENLNRDLKREL